MQTTVEIDDALLRQAREQARKQGRSLDTLLEDALRTVVIPAVKQKADQEANGIAEGLEASDPFFTALDEVRSFGRTLAVHRRVDLPQ